MKPLIRMLRYMKPYKVSIVLGLLTVILPSLMELLVPRLLQYVIDEGIRQSDMPIILRGSLLMFGAATIGAVTTLGQGICRANLSQGIAFDVRNNLFRHIQSLPFAVLDEFQTGEVMTRISSDVDAVRRFASNGLALLLRAVFMILGSVVMVAFLDLRLSGIMVIALIIAGSMIAYVINAAGTMFTVVQQKLSLLNTIAQENLAGRHVVKAFVRDAYEIDRFQVRNVEYLNKNIQVGRLLSLVTPVLTLLTSLGIAVVVWFGGLDVIGGRLTLGELVAYTNYLLIGMTPLLLLGNMLTMAAQANASARRVLELFARQPHATVPVMHESQNIEGHINFKNVSFAYSSHDGQNGLSDKSGNVLERLDFDVPAGKKVALLGVTGSGKTSLVNLVSRFYDVTGGRVLVDGVDVREWDIESLRSQIGIVMQQPILFSGTIRDNIAYGNPSASLEEVIAAAKAAQAHDFIIAMPDGYDSTVASRGVNFSGGQKQRIAIARALLTSPSILILDDSTSAVDLDTEIRIQDALLELLHDTTTIIIAQRINSVLDADKIMILENGTISASGTHTELLESSPIYQEIYQSQFGTDAPDLNGAVSRRK